MAGMNPTRLARENYLQWQQRVREAGTRFFRDKLRGFLLEAQSMHWNGYTGRVYCTYVLGREGFESVEVDYITLVPLSEMEVLALSFDSDS